MSAPADPKLLERLRARLRAGDTVTEAARACGVSDDVGRGMIRRHGREGPAPQPPPPIFLGALTPPPELPGPRSGCCCWPEGDRPHIRFECRNAPQTGSPYCAAHTARAFIRPAHRSDRPFVLLGLRMP